MPDFVVTRTSTWGTSCPCKDSVKYADGSYTVTLNTIAQLQKFVKEHGEIIIQEPDPSRKDARAVLFTLEIYDDYRE